MWRLVFLFPLVLAAACSRSDGAAAAASASKLPVAHRDASSDPVFALPPEACARAGYKAFFETFVRKPEGRGRWSLPSASLRDFDVALLDYSWVLASNEDALLDIDEKVAGDEFTVRARPVERDENDEVVKVLGPERTYRFRYSGGCWKFASAY